MAISEQEKAGAVYVLPEGYSESEYEMSEDEIAFNAFKNEAQDNDSYSKIAVSRVPMNRHGQRGGQKLIFLFECAVDEYSYTQLLGKLRDEYGSGFYKVQARNEKGQLKLNKTVAVEAPATHTDTASADSGQAAVIEQVSTALREHTTQQQQLMQSLMPQVNPMGSMVEMMTGLATVMKTMGIAQPAAPKTLVEQLTEFKMIKELFNSGDSGESGEANLYTLLGKTMDAFGGPLAAALAAGHQSGQVDANGVAIPAALPEPEPSHAEQATMAEEQKVYMRKQIHILLQNAKADIPPQQFALIVVNNTPEDQEDTLWEFVESENCVDQMIALEPAAEPYREWLTTLRSEIIDLMTEPEPETTQGLQDTGNGAKVADSGTAVAGADHTSVESGTPASDKTDNGDTPTDT